MATFPNYRFRHLVAFNLAGFFCISFVVFLTSSLPFFISSVVGQRTRIGETIGFLAVVDEITCIVAAPLVGSFYDKYKTGYRGVGGARFFVGSSLVLIALSFYLNGSVVSRVVPSLVFTRMLFALGVTGCMSLVPVLLAQLTHSDFSFGALLRKRPSDSQDNTAKSGKYAALVGISCGLGAIFSVSFFLTLPVVLSDKYHLSSAEGLKLAYIIIGTIAVAAAVYVFLFLYNVSADIVEDEEVHKNYVSVLLDGVSVLKTDTRVQLACVAGFVARSTNVLIAVFIPLLVFQFFLKSGQCSPSDEAPSKQNCQEGYIFAAILTGVAQTVALLASPFWGYFIDKPSFGKRKGLILSSIFGAVGCLGITVCNFDDPRNFLTFLFVSLIGVSQLGTTITGMSYISSLSSDFSRSLIGSVSGLSSLAGGLGILILSQIGGIWSDSWIYAPFLILGLFNIILVVTASVLKVAATESGGYELIDGNEGL